MQLPETAQVPKIDHMLKAARLVVEFERRREDMRRLHGAHYAERVKPFRQVLRGKATEESRPIVEVALALCKELDAKGHDPNLMFCASVEEYESPGEQL
jgi:hypothetical protein